ncbi:MAG: HAMP domain-containing sensor histidine kinase [bacterium]
MSLRTRLVLGLMAVVALGLGIAEVTTYYSIRSFMLTRVDEQVEAARGPATVRLLDERFRDIQPGRSATTADPSATGSTPTDTSGTATGDVRGGPPRGAPQNFQASIPPGTYAEVRFSSDLADRATSFGFEETYPIPKLPEDPTVAPGETRMFTADSVDGSQNFRVSASALPNSAGVLLVAVPMTEFDKTMDRLQLVGLIATVGVLGVLAVVAFWLVRLGLKPLDDFALTAANVAAGDMSQRMPVADPRTEIGRLGIAMNEMLNDLEDSFARRERSEQQLRRFLADASHELRTPLTSIRGYAELFGRGASSRPDDLQKVMGRITQQSERMSLIVEDLLLLARLDQDRPLAREPVDLQGIARDVVEEARDRQPTRQISFRSAGNSGVTGDSSRLYQVVNNLVSNALLHTPEDASVEVAVVEQGESVTLEVNDSGPGISAEDRDHVFEPFYRSSAGRARKDGGSGLGLAIVRAIVEAHQGSVSVGDREPHGASFQITLPRGA